MKRKTNLALELTAIAVMAVVVCVLGLLQYRWTDEIGAGEQDRLKSVLTSSVRSFDQEFSYDFEHICESFEIDPEEPASTIKSRIIRQYSDWLRTTSQANLLGGVMIWRADGKDGSPLEVLDRHDREFAKTAWPPDFAPLYPSLEKQFARLPVLMSGHAATYYPWTFYGDARALVRPIFKITSEVGESDMEVRPIGFLIVQIDSKFVTGHYFPELAGHDFQPSGFRVAVRTASAPHQAVYLSDASFPVSTPSPDAEINLIKSAGEEAERRGHPSIAAADPARGWELVAQHPAGSMEVAVARWRWENLAISLGLLAVLAASVALVFSVARKAERLGQFQMDFVAGISHELFTPLSVINSVVENLADGLADRPEKIQEYSDILRDQAGRTERLMEQIMLLASGRIDHPEITRHPIQIGGVVAQCVAASETALRGAGFTWNKWIEEDLPPIVADPVMVASCVENLVNNAIKYGRSNRWIAVRTHVDKAGSRDELRISVEDRGIGIPSKDLRHVFDPFYRVPAVREARVRGTGLGLFLVKRMMEQMGGWVTVTSEVGRGSVFVLHFPVPRSAEQSHPEPAWSKLS
jgi:signal transduction histidine kinase